MVRGLLGEREVLMEVLGTIHFFAIVIAWTYYLQKKIEPWPQWTVIPAYVIHVLGIAVAAFLIGITYA